MAPYQCIDLCGSDNEGRDDRARPRHPSRPSLAGKKSSNAQPAKDQVVANTKKPRGTLFPHKASRSDHPGSQTSTSQPSQLATKSVKRNSTPHNLIGTLRDPAKVNAPLAQLAKLSSRSLVRRGASPEHNDFGEEHPDASSFISAKRLGKTRPQADIDHPETENLKPARPLATVSSPLKRRRDDASSPASARASKKHKVHSSARNDLATRGTHAGSILNGHAAMPSRQRHTPPRFDVPPIDLTGDSPPRFGGDVVSLLSDEETDDRLSREAKESSRGLRSPASKVIRQRQSNSSPRVKHNSAKLSTTDTAATDAALKMKPKHKARSSSNVEPPVSPCKVDNVEPKETPRSAGGGTPLAKQSDVNATDLYTSVEKSTRPMKHPERLQKQGVMSAKLTRMPDLPNDPEPEIAESPDRSLEGADESDKAGTNDALASGEPETISLDLHEVGKSCCPRVDSGYTSVESHDGVGANLPDTATPSEDLAEHANPNTIAGAGEKAVLDSVEMLASGAELAGPTTSISLNEASDDRDSLIPAAELPKSNNSAPDELPSENKSVRTVIEQDNQPSTHEASATLLSYLPDALATSLPNQVERVLGRQLGEMRSTNEYWAKAWIKRAIASPGLVSGNVAAKPQSTNHAQQKTSFAAMKPLQTIQIGKLGKSSTKATVTFVTEKVASPSLKGSKKPMQVPVTHLETSDTMPSYSHYVSIKSNFLAPNATTMHCWPYFGDEFEMEKADGLKEQYKLDIVERRRKVLRLLQAEKYEAYVEAALTDLQIGWADILHLLYDDEPDVGNDADAKKALKLRRDYCAEDFTRETSRKAIVLSSLPVSSQDQLARAALLCENFQRMFKISLWHVARRHQFDFISGATSLADNNSSSLLDAMSCRVCLRFDCPYHGELKEHEDEYSEEGSDSLVDNAVVTDIANPPKVNYRTRAVFHTTQSNGPNNTSIPSAPTIKSSQHSVQYWQNYECRVAERGPFYPCHHPGSSCSKAECSCFVANIPCEKTCSCPLECTRRFKGCNCASKIQHKGHKLVCFEDDRCVCFQLGKECDPDLCGSCGVCDVIDPVHRQDDQISAGRCRNASIQRGVPKQTLLGDSGIHGLGLYAGEDISHHEFVGEYKGEIITKYEAERRGAVYEHQKLSYLFSLNADQEIDSTYFGNKIRFINHASNTKSNLYPRVKLVNTVHRIALYANRPIRKGDELFFDYGPQFPDEQLGGKTARASAPHVRNANLVRDEFYDIEEAEDEQGNRRARKVGRPRKVDIAGQAPAARERGGYRPGAERKSRAPTKLSQTSSGLISDNEDDTDDADTPTRRLPAARLAAYNISDDSRDDAVTLDARAGASAGEDDDFDPGAISSEESEESVRSEIDDD